tara:strand:+ start:572 stop:856 length:285 start_codon:yes stop_codon:yes gene_type:complete
MKINKESLITGISLKPTAHFIERYIERIFKKCIHGSINHKKEFKKIRKDMNNRLSAREKNFLRLFVSSSCNVILPLGSVNELVIKNGKLITVLN